MYTSTGLREEIVILFYGVVLFCNYENSDSVGKLNIRWLTLTVLVATIDAQWEGMGYVGSARYEPALLPPYPTIRVLSYSN